MSENTFYSSQSRINILYMHRNQKGIIMFKKFVPAELLIAKEIICIDGSKNSWGIQKNRIYLMDLLYYYQIVLTINCVHRVFEQ